MGLGRNDPCYCGSGKKYKRCHLDIDRDAQRAVQEAWPEVQAKMAAQQEETRLLREQYGVDINYVRPTVVQGRKVWAIGSRVYLNRRPNETFHEFIIDVLLGTLGREWYESQDELPERERHFVRKCFDEWGRFRQDNTDPEALARDGHVSAEANGWVSYLASLAWDVATLIHAADLPDGLVKRLRDRNAFQGARYEIAIAAMFARLNCKIRFLDDVEELRGLPHVEFEATHEPTGQTFAVEAKSRHRTGVIHQAGDVNADDPLHKDERMVRQLFRKALDKAPTRTAYFIFIDINAPLDADTDERWRTGIQRWMDRMPAPTDADPSAFNGLLVTNFSPHYAGDNITQGGSWLGVLPSYVRTPVVPGLHEGLFRALDTYGRVPAFDQDGVLQG